MLIEFAVTNFRSFRERQVLSLLPSKKIREREVEPLKVETYPKLEVLSSAVLYGPNNAGKSNLLRAIDVLKQLICNSGNYNSDKKLDANDFFGFNVLTQNQPTTFEIDFIAPNKKRYKYLITFSSKVILKEELYVFNVTETGKTTVKTLYERNEQIIEFPALKGFRERIRFGTNQLFLSRGDIEGNQELQEVYSFFANHLFVFQFTETEYTDFLTKAYARLIAENKIGLMPTKLIDSILRETNTDILGIQTDVADTSKIRFVANASQEIKDKILEQIKYDLRTQHKLFNGQTEIGETTLLLNEQSVGTRKLLGLAPLIISALEDGDTLLIDEMNTSMHTEITSWLIGLFNNPITNPNNAQLVITTHDITLLHKHLYEKDQIFIVEKDKYGASDLYSFVDVTGIRSNNRLSDYYETGRLGGVPHIAKPYLEHVISEHLKDAKTKEKK